MGGSQIPATWSPSNTRVGVRMAEYGYGSFPTAESRFQRSRWFPETFISATGPATCPPRTWKPRTPREKSPVVPFEFPPRNPVTSSPSPRAASSSAGERGPSAQARFEARAVVGAMPSFRP